MRPVLDALPDAMSPNSAHSACFFLGGSVEVAPKNAAVSAHRQAFAHTTSHMTAERAPYGIHHRQSLLRTRARVRTRPEPATAVSSQHAAVLGSVGLGASGARASSSLMIRRAASAVVEDDSIEQVSSRMTTLVEQRVPPRPQATTSQSARWVEGQGGGGAGGAQEQAFSSSKQGQERTQMQQRQDGGDRMEKGRQLLRAGDHAGGADAASPHVNGAVSSGTAIAVEDDGVDGGESVGNVAVKRQKDFVKRVVELGMRRRARDVLDLMNYTERVGSPPFNLYMYNACITAFGRCGWWRNSLAILDGMLQVGTIAADETGAAGVSRSEKPVVRPDVVTYSAAISACANAGQRRRALELLHDMRADGVPPNVVSYNTAAHACVNYMAVEERGDRLAQSNRNGIGKRESHTRSVVGRREEGWSIVLGLMAEMRAEGLSPDAFTFSTAITACGRAGQWERALSLLEEMGTQPDEQHAPDLVAVNSAIAACGRAGQCEIALNLLSRLRTHTGDLVGSVGRVSHDEETSTASGQERADASSSAAADQKRLSSAPNYGGNDVAWPVVDSVSFNAAMEACAKGGRWQDGVALLSRMRESGAHPDIRSYAAAFACLRAGGDWKGALELLEEMEAGKGNGLSPDLGCYGAALSALGEAGEWERALEVLRRLQQHRTARTAACATGQTAAEAGWDAERFAEEASGSAALTSLATSGPNLVCYNAVMAACARAAAWSPALALLEEMEEQGIFDTASFNCAMRACRGQGQWRKATGILARMVGGDASRSSCGVERTVPAPDVYSFSAVIAACGAVGQGDRAVELLHEMKDAGVAPNVVVFNAALAAVAKGINRHDDSWRKREPAVDESIGVNDTGRGGNGGGGGEHEIHAAPRAETSTPDELAVGERWKRARALLAEMREAGLTPDLHSYNTVLAVCQRVGAWEGALEVLEEMKRGLTRRPATSDGDVAAPTVWIGETVPPPDLISFNTAMGACGKASRWEEALRLLEELPAFGLTPDVFSFNTAAAACTRAQEWDFALDIINRGRRAGVITAPAAFSSVGKEATAGSEGKRRDGSDGEAVAGGGARRQAVTANFYASVEAMVRNKRGFSAMEYGGVAGRG